MGCSDNFVHAGLMTWFCCGNAYLRCATTGTGACGNCQNTRHQCAWPNISDACHNLTRPEDCGISLARYGCGHGFYAVNKCSEGCVFVTIATCGPDTNSFCGEFHSCGSYGGQNRIIDLTPSAWLTVVSSLDAGPRPCTVHN